VSGVILSFKDVLEKFRKESFSERDKGGRFELLMKKYLQVEPQYKNRLKTIWLWNEFPFRKDFSGKDTGIDLVAQTYEGDYWAIQCKCYAEDNRIDKAGVDSFLATSSKSFVNENAQTVMFKQRLWISTTNNWNSEAEETIKNQNPPVARISLTDLENSSEYINWDELVNGTGNALKKKKTLRDHQKEALEAFAEHFKVADRGQLIMACGTGKTFSSLKLAEQETKNNGTVLFLVPSIALLGQTLREWTSQSDKPIYPICICSDATVSKNDNEDASVVDLALPATTNVSSIVQQFNYAKKSHKEGMIVVFSTYQSIDVISKAQKEMNKQEKDSCIFDLIICDEAHRTTGVILKDKEKGTYDESAFTKVHDNEFIVAKKRVYMTATPRLYTDVSKQKAEENEALLCSMDDEAIYGPVVYRIGFGKAVAKNLLADYKVLILTLKEEQIPEAFRGIIAGSASSGKEISADDVSKLIGCINALSKRVIESDETFNDDKNPMKKAVAFCQKIVDSKKIASMFNEHKDTYYNSLTQEERDKLVGVEAKHIDGGMGASQRDELLSWLKNTPADSKDCRILTNVKCLSEGVDVPSLDAVMFLAAKNSQVDVVQSVGRVMRVAEGKKYGYIIIPIMIPEGVKPEDALDDNKRYAVVWSVLNALRAHDDRFDAEINKINFNKKKGGKINVIGIGGGEGGGEGTGESTGQKATQINLPLPELQELQNVIYAKMVQKVGSKRYWVQWAQDVAKIAQRYVNRIKELIAVPGKHQNEFNKFWSALKKNINPAVSEEEVIQMLAQHLITQPVFEALFENYSFVQNNPVSKSLQKMVDLLEEQSMEKDRETLNKFYESVKERVAGIDNAEAKQKIIVELYDKFFKTAFPKVVEQLGIVYTPVEVVDFINHSVAAVLKKEFNRSLSDENIHILDPFTGTGTFITRLLQTGLIDKEVLPRKYAKELHANEIVLLAYYIASINIENAYHDIVGADTYKPFNGICLTDTFQLGETGAEVSLFTDELPQNSKRVMEQKKLPVRVIIGNPPYSIGQKSEDDNAKNQSYPKLDSRIAETYVKHSNAVLNRGLYDSYIKAFRWASDRIDDKNGGIVAFITNSGWIDTNGMDGFRKCLEKEFNSIYVFNLRGRIRGNIGDRAKREGQNVFDIMTGVAITILVKNPKVKTDKATIYYHDIGDYLKRSDKLEILKTFKNINNSKIEWKVLKPNDHGDWLNQRSDLFSSFIAMGDKDNTKQVVFNIYSGGLLTSRNAWCYNFSKNLLKQNMKNTIDFYNEQRKIYHKIAETDREAVVEKVLEIDQTKISWSRALKNNIKRNLEINYQDEAITVLSFRPFMKEYAYFDRNMNEMVYQQPKLFPTREHKNVFIMISGGGGVKPFFAFICNTIKDYDTDGGVQCFPLYYYEKNDSGTGTLFDQGKETYTRRDAITDFILEQCRERYGHKVTKEDIFYYVYGLLHSNDYRTQFAADLKKVLPRIPLVDIPNDFWAFSKAGRELAELHLNYENIPAYPDVKVEGEDSGNFKVVKMAFAKNKGEVDKTTIIYNSSIKITNIPLEVYDFIVDGKSGLEWIMDRYQVKTDKDSGIKNDPNDWGTEHNNPRYILDLILSVITVSMATNEIVKNLPKLDLK
jgi:predicted helicase